MRKIREILRLRWQEGLSYAAIAQSVGAGRTTVLSCLTRAQAAEVTWPLAPALDDGALEGRLYPGDKARRDSAAPDFEYVHKELRRKGVTLLLLWQEYKKAHPGDGYQYSRFCDLYNEFRGRLDAVMHQVYRAGEKLFVDFSGDGIPMVDPRSGEITEAPLFVAVLGASSYCYAEAMASEELPCWIQGHVHAFDYFSAVPAVIVPDNTKTAVTKPCYYEPDLNPTYLEMSRHYDTVILPARVKKPRDKAPVENGVLITQRWILEALRNHTFFSVEQINEAVREKLEDLNTRKFQKLDTTRRELFETLDRPAMRPLPPSRYEFGEWSRPKVSIDYHVDVDHHLYSVPCGLLHHRLDARMTATVIEIFFKGNRVASHSRSFSKGYTTLKEHMPPSHQHYLEWSPSRILKWAEKTGPATAKVAEAILASRPHPEQGYRACLGVMRLGKVHGTERLEAACARALAIGAFSYKSVESILKGPSISKNRAAGAGQ